MYRSCDECKNKCRKEGKINISCLGCMRAYGVHSQEENEEASSMYIGFPKADLFEPIEEEGASDGSVYQGNG